MTEPNLTWLFWAYGAGWFLVFGYLFWMSRREQSLRRRLERLRELLEKDWGRK